jgi:hypothetical protein
LAYLEAKASLWDFALERVRNAINQAEGIEIGEAIFKVYLALYVAFRSRQ